MGWERKIQEETAKKNKKMAVKERGADGEDYKEEEEEEEELEEKESSSSCTKQQQQMGMEMDVDEDGDDENEQDDQGVKSWEAFLRHRLLPKGGSLRVLLVEGDDSTRHIIAALLRKCNYRVSAVSDGLKAWEILKERPEGVDVVLAEVEVPSITGISLLSMIMDHPSCKHIPVIMMSSNDSVNMVFKCMLKGAADFLVKPIRKNELRNLWQHVWRRHNVCSIPTPCVASSSDGHGGINVQRDDNAKRELDEASSQKENQLSGVVPPVQIHKECSEKGSDAESSCTRSDMEAESTYKQITLLEPQQTSKGFSPPSDAVCQNGGQKIQLNTSLLDLESKAEEFTPCNETSIENVQLLEEEHSCAQVNEQGRPMESTYKNNIQNEMDNEICHQGAPPKQIIDLIGAIDNQRQRGYGQRNNVGINHNVYGTPEDVFCDGDFSYKSGSMPLLELSLRRYQDKEEKYGRSSTLNHSNSSAFSPYGARTTVSPFSRTAYLSAEGEEHSSPSTKQIQDKDFDSPSNAPRWNGTARHLITEDAKSLNAVSSIPNGSVAIKCSPIRVIPMPSPLGGINFDGSAGYHVARQPILYPESSGLHRWSNTPSKGQETVPMAMECSDQSDTREFYISHQHLHSQPPKGPIFYSSQNEHPKVEARDETRQHVSSVTGDSASSTKCHDNANHIHSNGLVGICHKSNGNNISTTTMPSGSTAAELRNQVEKKPTDLHRLIQREAALNKFRLKRKDRCFEKKVRYQSRKRLAEQRPRVKGQFVRHIQPDALTTEAGSYQIEPAVV